MEREGVSNNGTPRLRPVRLFGVEITLPGNGDRRRQPRAMHVRSLTITQLPNQIDFLPPGFTRNPAFISSIAGGPFRSRSSVRSSVTTGATGAPPEVAALPPPPSPPHRHPHQPAVAAVPPPPPPQNANNRSMDPRNLIMRVEIGLRERMGENVDPGLVDAVVQLIENTLEALAEIVNHNEILNVHLSIELEEIMDSFNRQDHPGLSEEVIRSLLGTSTFETSSEDKDSCCICLDEFSTGDELGKINCDHKFHFTCILEWLKRNNICPICRATALSLS